MPVFTCAACGRVYFEPLDGCSHCGAELTESAASGRGKVYSYSAVHIGQGRLEAPYVLALVDLEGAGRVLGRVDGRDMTRIRVNDTVFFEGVSGGVSLFELAESSEKNRGREK